MKQINLSNGGYAIVDDEDYGWLSKYRWFSYGGYAYRAESRKVAHKNVSMHRQIMGDPVGKWVDHRNRNRLDNRKSNLRTCDISENNSNTKRRSDNKSGYRGVSFSKKNKAFVSQIKKNNKTFFLGLFKDPIEAAKAYDEAAKELHGEFSVTNF